MSTRDINARFDDIVAFSEIAQFIDMPVKHYSSGMYARLGFAVAAFLKPDILIVDEILAVGDLNFQAKCLAHMRRLAQDGTTVLFVSHNLLAMADLCPRAMVMADGRLFFDGPTPMAIGAYRRTLIASTAQVGVDGLRPTHELRINGRADAVVETAPNSALSVELEIDQSVDAAPIGVVLNLTIEAGDGRPAVHLRNDLDGTPLSLGPGRNGLMVEIEDLSLAPGAYTLSLRVVALDSANPSIWETDRIELLVLGDSRLTSILQPRHRFAQRG
jgi:lipopolysaccharide transport system ATP-binding protein